MRKTTCAVRTARTRQEQFRYVLCKIILAVLVTNWVDDCLLTYLYLIQRHTRQSNCSLRRQHFRMLTRRGNGNASCNCANVYFQVMFSLPLPPSLLKLAIFSCHTRLCRNSVEFILLSAVRLDLLVWTSLFPAPLPLGWCRLWPSTTKQD